MIIYFGKHAGKEVESLPSSYLCWLVEECDFTEQLVREASKQELVRRLSLDWKLTNETLYLAHVQKELNEASKLVLFYCRVLKLFRFNFLIAQKYFLNPNLLDADIESINSKI